jgi:hypothetical protein
MVFIVGGHRFGGSKVKPWRPTLIGIWISGNVEYGRLPRVNTSQMVIPYDHTSDELVNLSSIL